MKIKFLQVLTMTVVLLLCSGCNKDENRYYVRYDAVISTSYYGDSFVTVKNEKGQDMTFEVGGNTFSETFGPVSKDFAPKMSTYVTHYRATVTQNIYVSKSDEPFALKATKTAGTPTESSPLELSCQIDF